MYEKYETDDVDKGKTTFFIEDVHVFKDSGWFVATDSETGISVVGTAILPPYGRINTICTFKEHYRFGPQYIVEKILYEKIDDLIVPLLASGFITHIGVVKAQNVQETFGSEFFSIIEAAANGDRYDWEGENLDPKQLLCQVKGIASFTAGEIVESWKEKRVQFRAALDAIRCGLSPEQFRWATSDNGHEKFSKMVHNIPPYNIYDLLSLGISWKDVDHLALQNWEDKPAIGVDDPIRMAGGVKYALNTIADSRGHMGAKQEDIDLAAFELGIYDPLEKLENLADYGLTIRGEYLYLKENIETETKTAKKIVEIMQTNAIAYSLSPEQIGKFTELTLNEEQVKAVKMVLENKFSIITGGPGTGKTTVLDTIVKILQNYNQKITLCAPTGNAARRMMLATGYEAFTLHRRFQLFRDPEEQEEVEHGWLFVDEMSMSSAELTWDFLKNVRADVHVCFIGDPDQLPPVGKGEPLLQLLESDIPVTRLTHIYRQQEGNAIIQACHDINHGIMPTPDNKDFFIKSVASQELVVKTVMSAINWLRGEGFSGDNIQVLSPLNGSDIGQKKLNEDIKEVFNPNWKAKKTPIERKTPIGSLSIDDRVLQTRNNYDLNMRGVMNGQIGRIDKLTEEGAHVLEAKENKTPMPTWLDEKPLIIVEFEEEELVAYRHADTFDLNLAYAMTIHKSQGGQFPCVIMVVPHTNPGFQLRQLIYTGASRPKKKLIIIEQQGAMIKYIKNEKKLRRHSILGELIKEVMNGSIGEYSAT